jgi:hypothetical protein
MNRWPKNTEYRNCFKTDTEPECPFADFNEYGTNCCTIDNIVQTRWYGCVPQEVIDKESEKYENE